MSKLLLGIEYRAEATESPKIWGATKDQLVSICHFGVFKSSKKPIFPGFVPWPTKRGQIKKVVYESQKKSSN